MHLINEIILLNFLLSLGSAQEEAVLDLTDETFETTLSSYDTALVMFYAPWCGHCKKLKPEYAKAAGELMRDDVPVALFRINCEEGESKETCGKYVTEGYPTLKVFQNGEFAYEYDGPRDALGIATYMEESIGLGSEAIGSLDHFQKFVDSKEDICVIGFFTTESGLKEFLKIANKFRRKIAFGHSFFEPIVNQEGFQDQIVLYRPKHLRNKFESDKVVYSGEGPFEEFVTKNRYGLVGHRTQNNHEEFKIPLIVVFYNIDYINDPKGTNYIRNRVFKVAQNYKDKITFAISSKYDFYKELEAFGVEDIGDKRPLVLAKNGKNEKFKMEENFSVDALEKFVFKFLNDKLQPSIKSQPVPEKNEGPLLVAVAKNFNDVVVNNNKDTLIEFYAPWCGHCKQLSPTYETLAKELKNEDVAVVNMDATANDIPDNYTVSGFPTIYWKSRTEKYVPVLYQDGRELEDFIKYVARHATSELKSFDRDGNSRKIKTEL